MSGNGNIYRFFERGFMVVLGNVSLCLQFVIYIQKGINYTIFKILWLAVSDDVYNSKHHNMLYEYNV